MSHFSFSIEQVTPPSTAWHLSEASHSFNDVIDPSTDFKVSSIPRATEERLLRHDREKEKCDLNLITNLESMKNVTTSLPNVPAPSVHKIHERPLGRFRTDQRYAVEECRHLEKSVSCESMVFQSLLADAEKIPSRRDDSNFPSVSNNLDSDVMEQFVNKKLHQYPPHEITTYRERKSYLNNDPQSSNNRVKKPPLNDASISSESGFSDSFSFESSKMRDAVQTSSTPDKHAQDAHVEFVSWIESRVASLSSQLNASILDNQTLRKDYDSLILKLQKEEKCKYDELLKAHSNMEERAESMKQDIREFIGERSRLLKMISSLQADVRNGEDKLSEAEDKMRKMSSDSTTVVNRTTSDVAPITPETSSNSKFTQQIKLLRGTLECRDTALSLLKQTHAETIRDLHQNIAANVQSQGELTSLRSEVTALERSRSWYKEQLLQAQATKNELRQELMNQQQLADSLTLMTEKMKEEVVEAKQQMMVTEKQADSHRQALTQQLVRIEEDLKVGSDESGNEEVLLQRLKQLEEERSETHILNFKISDLQQQLSNASSKLVARENNLVKAEHENKQLHATLAYLNKQITAKDIDIQQLESRHAATCQAIKDINSGKEEREKELERTKEKATSLQSALVAANNEKTQVDAAVAQLKTELVKIAKKFKRFQSELKEKERIVSILSTENKQFRAKLDDVATQAENTQQTRSLAPSTAASKNNILPTSKEYDHSNQHMRKEDFEERFCDSFSKFNEEYSTRNVSDSNFPETFKALQEDKFQGPERTEEESSLHFDSANKLEKTEAEQVKNREEDSGIYSECALDCVSSLNEPRCSEIPVTSMTADSSTRASLRDHVFSTNTVVSDAVEDPSMCHKAGSCQHKVSNLTFAYEKSEQKCLLLERQLCALRETYEENQKEVQAKARDIEAMLTQIARLERCLEEQTCLNQNLKDGIEKELEVRKRLERELCEKETLEDKMVALAKQYELVQGELHLLIDKGKDQEEKLVQMQCLQQELKESRSEKENLQNMQNVLEERVKSMEDYTCILNEKIHAVELERNKLSEELHRCKPEVVESLTAEPDVIQNTGSGSSFSVAVQTDSLEEHTAGVTDEHKHQTVQSEHDKEVVQSTDAKQPEESRISAKVQQLLKTTRSEIQPLLAVHSNSNERCIIKTETLTNILKGLESMDCNLRHQPEESVQVAENNQQMVAGSHAALGVQQSDFDSDRNQDSTPPSPTPLEQELIQNLLERNSSRKMNSQTMARLHGCLQSLNEDVKRLNERLNHRT